MIMRTWYPGRVTRCLRRFYASEDVIANLESAFWQPRPQENRERLIRCRWELFSLIKDWCDGEYIRPGEDLKPLDAWRGTISYKGIWEFRTSIHNPKLRLLGVLPERNTFVGLSLYRRDELGAGRRGGWTAAAERIERSWEEVGSGRPVLCFHGEDLSDEEARRFWDEHNF